MPSLFRGQDGGHDVVAETAEVDRQSGLGAFHLTLAGLAAELLDQLDDLRDARRAQRMTLGLQTAGGVDRHLAVDLGLALARSQMAGAAREEADFLGLRNLQDLERVMQLGHVDVLGTDARHLVRHLGAQADGQQIRRDLAVGDHVRVGRRTDARDLDELLVAKAQLFLLILGHEQHGGGASETGHMSY